MTYPPHIHGPTVERLRQLIGPYIPFEPNLDLDELFYAVALAFSAKRCQDIIDDDAIQAKAICEVARHLVASDELQLPSGGLFGALVVEQERPELLQALQVEWAIALGTDLSGMTERAIALVDGALSSAPSVQAWPFVRRLARCFLLGLSPEGIIMCRAALELSLAETCRRKEPGTRLANEDSTWHDQLRHAVHARWLTDELAASAIAIRRLGNKAVHHSPGTADGEEWAAFRDTMTVLEALAAA